MKTKSTILNKIFSLGLILVCFMNVTAQESEPNEIEKIEIRTRDSEETLEKLKKFKVSGYIQGQFQHGEKNASLKVGSANEDTEKSFNRFGIRRGRIKFTYEEGIASGVFQLDITEKGVGFKDAYINIKDPWIKTCALRAGIFDRPFGYEISYSSSRRESPERSTVFQTLFPDERDLGVMLILQPSKNSALNFLKLEGGFFAGNGIKLDTDSRKDFIGHLSAAKSIGSNFKFGIGASYYNGRVYQGTSKVYEPGMENGNKGFILNNDTVNYGKFAKREYFGFDGQISLISVIGMTQLRAEYLFGEQPGLKNSTKSPNSSTLPNSDTYIRNFSGGYVMFIQDIGKLPFSVVFKYDWYDPNTDISGNEAGLNGTGKSDLSQNTIGFGALWRANKSIRLQAYYEINNYEKTENISGIDDIKANVFTLRLQYKF